MMMFGVLFLTLLSLSHVMAEDILLQVRQEVNGGCGGGGGGSGSDCGTNCGDSFEEEEEEEETVEPTPPTEETVEPTSSTEETVVTTTPNYGACEDDDNGNYLAYSDSKVDYVFLKSAVSLSLAKWNCEQLGMTMITSRPDVYGFIEQNIKNCQFGPEVWVDFTEDIDLDSNWVGTTLGDFSIPPDTSRPAGEYGVVIHNSDPTGFLKEFFEEESVNALCYLDKN